VLLESGARINCEQDEPAQRAAEYSPGWSEAEPGECSAQYREPAQRATDTENKKWHCGPPPATRPSETFGDIPRVPLRSTRGYIPPPASQA